jgi:hypothetical protein
MRICYCTLPSTDRTACSRCSNNEKPFQDLNVRPYLRGRYIVTEEYIDGHLTRKTVEMPDDQIRIEGTL